MPAGAGGGGVEAGRPGTQLLRQSRCAVLGAVGMEKMKARETLDRSWKQISWRGGREGMACITEGRVGQEFSDWRNQVAQGAVLRWWKSEEEGGSSLAFECPGDVLVGGGSAAQARFALGVEIRKCGEINPLVKGS